MSVHHALWSGDQQMHPGGAARFGLGDNTLNRPHEHGFLRCVIGRAEASSGTGFGRRLGTE